MKKGTTIKFLGIVATIIGCGATILSDWVNEKSTEEKIKEEVNAALAEREKES